VTVNLKDFKAMMGLCESLGTHIKLSFDSPGNPLVAEPHFAHAHGHGQVRGAVDWLGAGGSARSNGCHCPWLPAVAACTAVD
jgi:hypothetical protein